MCQGTFGCGSNPYETLWNCLKESLTLRILEKECSQNNGPDVKAMQKLLDEMKVSEKKLLQAEGFLF